MATFSFEWQRIAGRHRSLRILKTGNRQCNLVKNFGQTGVGCGRQINWSMMAKVPVPDEFKEAKIGTDDIKDLPRSAQSWVQRLREGIVCAGSNFNNKIGKLRRKKDTRK